MALQGLEALLMRWLSTERDVLDRVGVKLEDIAGAVVALSVARYSSSYQTCRF